MDKYVAQLQQDTGATPENIVEAAGSGGSLVTITESGTAPNLSYSADKTFDEISEAASGGTTIMFALVKEGEKAFGSIVRVRSEVIDFFLPAALSISTDHYIVMSVLSLDSTNAITQSSYIATAQNT